MSLTFDILKKQNAETSNAVIDHFNKHYFQGHLTDECRRVLLDFVNTDDANQPSPWATRSNTMKQTRLRDLIALLLASPDFQFQ